MKKIARDIKMLWCLAVILSLAFAASAIDIAIIGVRPHTTEQWVDAEKISGTLYKVLNNSSLGLKVLSSSQVTSLIGDRKAYLESHMGGIPQLPNVDAVVMGEIVPQGNSFKTTVRLYNLRSNQSVEYSLSGNPLNLDKKLADGLFQTLSASMASEHKVVSVSGPSIELMTTGIGAFRGQKFNVYRQEQPGNEAFAKYMKSPMVKVGEVEVIAVNGKVATARILKEDPWLKIKVGDYVSRRGVVGFGALEIDSIPRGANVYLDGFLIGRTPLNIRNIPEGTYHLKFTEPQHSDHTETVKVRADNVTRVSPTLPEKPGRLQISSNKVGELYINNVKRGKTPLTVELPKGLYRLELVVPGYPSQEQSIWVTPGLISPIFFNISGSPAESYFESSPSDAAVYLDGNFIGNTPIGPYYVEPGYHDIKMVKPGWRDWTETKLFYTGRRENVKAEMLLPPGTITVYSEPSRATVKVDGKVVGTTPLTYPEAGPGMINVEISKEGYRTINNTINIYSNEKLVIEETLERKVGTLTIKSEPSAKSKIYIDGVYKGLTPFVLEKLPEGKYKVELFSGNLAYRDTVSIRDREVKEITANLVPYVLLPNVEKRLVVSLGTEFSVMPLILGVNGSLPLAKNIGLRAGFDYYGGDFGGGYGEYAQYNTTYAGLDYYVADNFGIFGLARYRNPKEGDPVTDFGGGLSVRLMNPDMYVLNARIGALYRNTPSLFWEVELNTKIGIPNFVIGAKIGSSPLNHVEGRLQVGLTF